MKKYFGFLFFGFVAYTQAFAQNQPKGLSMAENFLQLPYFKTGTQTYQLSSTDPAEDQFNDYSHWQYSDKDSNAVLADIEGPGSIYRIWTTGNTGDTNRLKVFIDGENSPRIDETFNSFHNHKPLRDMPQVGAGGDKYLAWWSYMPVSFKKSIKIVREGNFRPFYNITYHTYSDAAGLTSWNGKEDLSKMETIWNNPESDPKPVAGNQSKKIIAKFSAGQAISVFNHTGKGYVAAIKISNYSPDKNFRIKIYWDGEKTPSVDAPVKWFFGSIDNGGDLKALGVGTVNNNGYCYFPMPFWKSAKIELVNNSDRPVDDVQVDIVYNKNAYPENSCGYFHAKANEVDKPGKSYSCLKTKGRGHIIGMAKRMPAGGHACEADEIFYIDNRRFPDIYGTGEEDYANCAWWRNSYNSYPTHGCVGNDCYYRMHYPDVIVYEQGLDMEFESWQNYYIASLVWYYEKDKSSLFATDSIDIMNTASEQKHSFTITGETWSGTKDGKYPGKRIYNDSLGDDGRSFSGSSEFKIAIDKNNKGVRLRVRTENTNFQAVHVFVDGKLVEERDWVISKNNYTALWIDADFEIPAKYTMNKSTVKVKLEHVPEFKDWAAYRYDVFSYR